jgi:hypothetical protein
LASLDIIRVSKSFDCLHRAAKLAAVDADEGEQLVGVRQVVARHVK